MKSTLTDTDHLLQSYWTGVLNHVMMRPRSRHQGGKSTWVILCTRSGETRQIPAQCQDKEEAEFHTNTFRRLFPNDQFEAAFLPYEH